MKVNGKDDIPYMTWKIKVMFETNKQKVSVIFSVTEKEKNGLRESPACEEVFSPTKTANHTTRNNNGLFTLLCFFKFTRIYYTMLYHTIPYDTIRYHTIPYFIILYFFHHQTEQI